MACSLEGGKPFSTNIIPFARVADWAGEVVEIPISPTATRPQVSSFTTKLNYYHTIL